MISNSRKHEGFTLVEVIISITIISIMLSSAYSGYLLLIRQTKEGQVNQTVALAGKKTLEIIKNINIINEEDGKITFKQDDKDIVLNDKNGSYEDILHLDNDFNICDDQSSNDYSYLQKILIKSIKSNNEEISIDKNNKSNNVNNNNVLEDYFNLGKDERGVYINRENSINKYIESQDGKVRIYIYLKTDNQTKILNVEDSNENDLLNEEELGTVLDKSSNKKNEVDLYINFEKLGNDLNSVELYVSNKNEEENSETNIYLQKSSDVDAKVTFNEGQGYVYNNRAEEDDYESYKIGSLYDIEVRIWKKGEENEEPLFTGYSTQNININ